MTLLHEINTHWASLLMTADLMLALLFTRNMLRILPNLKHFPFGVFAVFLWYCLLGMWYLFWGVFWYVVFDQRIFPLFVPAIPPDSPEEIQEKGANN